MAINNEAIFVYPDLNELNIDTDRYCLTKFDNDQIRELTKTIELIQNNNKCKIDRIFYWYCCTSDDMTTISGGIGYMLILLDGYWVFYDCGHCSCNGPLNNFYNDINVLFIDKEYADCYKMPKLDISKYKATQEFKKFVQPLIDEAKEYGYK